MNTQPVVVLIHYRALAGQEEVAARELAALIEKVVASEPDCSGITMLRESADPTRILLHELWTTREAYLGPHMRTPHIQDFVRRAGEFMAGPPEISFWQTYAEV
jgi:quinol monooxygenase YgiN